MSIKFRPNYDLETTEERIEYVENIINNEKYELNNTDLTNMSNYILYSNDKAKKEQKSYINSRLKEIPVEDVRERKNVPLKTFKINNLGEEDIILKDQIRDIENYKRELKKIKESDKYYLAKALQEFAKIEGDRATTERAFHQELNYNIKTIRERRMLTAKADNDGEFSPIPIDTETFPIEYTCERTIYILLKYYTDILSTAQGNIGGLLHAIQLDVDNMIDNTDLTAHEYDQVELLRLGYKTSNVDRKAIQRAVKKITDKNSSILL